MSTEVRASWRRVLQALALGHLAAACSFGALATVFVSFVDPDGARALKSGAVLELAKIATMYDGLSLIARCFPSVYSPHHSPAWPRVGFVAVLAWP